MTAVPSAAVDRSDNPWACDRCMDYLGSTPNLIPACATVGIEHGRSTDFMLRQHLVIFHRAHGTAEDES